MDHKQVLDDIEVIKQKLLNEPPSTGKAAALECLMQTKYHLQKDALPDPESDVRNNHPHYGPGRELNKR